MHCFGSITIGGLGHHRLCTRTTEEFDRVHTSYEQSVGQVTDSGFPDTRGEKLPVWCDLSAVFDHDGDSVYRCSTKPCTGPDCVSFTNAP